MRDAHVSAPRLDPPNVRRAPVACQSRWPSPPGRRRISPSPARSPMRLMYRTSVALACAALLGAVSLAAQKPTKRPAAAARADTAARPDTAAGAKDSLTRFLEGFSFRNLGPAAYSGRVTALAVPHAAGYPNTFYVGAAGGGVWKTTNGGITWQSVSEGLGVQTIGDLAVAPSDTNIVWVGTGEKNSLRSQWWGDGVYKSADGGKKWTNVGLKDTRSIGRIVLHPTNPDIVYVAALGHLWGTNPERGIYKTTDGGKTWSRILFVNDTTGFVDLEMDPGNPEVLYAAAWHRLRWGGSHMQGVGKGSGIYKTADGGKSWTKLTDPALKNGLPTDRLGRIGLAVSAKDPKVVYATIQVDRGVTDPLQGRYGGVFRSSDAGATWTQVNDLQAIPHYYYDDIWIDPTNPDHVWTVSPALLESKDGGKSFAPDSLHLVHGDYHALWIDRGDPQHLIIGNDGGVYVSRDGGKAWEHMAIPIRQFYTVVVGSSRTPYQVCGNHLIRMTHRGDDWEVLGPDMTRASREHPSPEVGHTSYHAVFAIAESPRSKDVVWAGSDDGLVWLTRDGGKTWAELSASFPKGAPTSCWGAAIVPSYHVESRAYLVYDCHSRDDYGPHVYRTEDFGKTWTEVGKALPADQGSLTVFEDPVNQRLLWVGTATGAYVTLDGGKSWRRFGKNLPTVPVESMAMSFAQRDLVVSTHGRGLWITNVVALEEMTDTLLAEAVHLFQVPTAYQYRPRDTYPDWGSRPFVAPNPPRGAG